MVAAGLVALVVFLFPASAVIRQRPSRAEQVRSRAKFEMSSLVAALRQYRDEYHLLPSGTHAEILGELRGDNAKKVIFFEANSRSFNSGGELMDPWGMPYRFHGEERGIPRVYSYGPNKQDDGGREKTDDVVSWR
jgi:hypothetical protein